MKNLWNEDEAAQCGSELALRVYSSRLLGREPALVMHGGGNTSVKIREKDIFGNDQDLLYVKGSGWDLVSIEEAGFSPVDLQTLVKLSQLESLSDPQMVNELRTHMTRANAPTPSVEAILHAILPYQYVDHTHADALITVTNNPNGQHCVEEIYGDDVVVIPYCMPGFDLARLVAKLFPERAHANTLGMVLMNHGLFSFADDARQSYERMIELVTRAEDYLKTNGAWNLPANETHGEPFQRLELAEFRHRMAESMGRPVILDARPDAQALAFARHPEVGKISQQGPATPDHVIRTKRLPMLGRDINHYLEAYEAYFQQHQTQGKDAKQMLDPVPRVILDEQWGLLTVGKTAKEAAIVRDIYQHTIEIILRAEMLQAYQALPAQDIFDVEYWDLEQAKLKKAGGQPQFAGEVVLVTGGASGIGKACVKKFLQNGAAVVSLDKDPSVSQSFHDTAFLGISCDVTREEQIEGALDLAVRRFGGLDMLVLNAGVFPGGCEIAELAQADWQRVMDVNLNSNLALMRLCQPLLKLAASNGRMVIMGSKNVPAPGPGAAAYSASKAALNQLARIAALEWAKDGIRVNTLHPDAVFDTGIWSPEVLQARANYYGMSVQDYKTKNLLKVEICSEDIAELVQSLCSPLFHKITGAQLAVDGGNDRTL